MNKFFKRLALLLAVLMIVSMMPVQLFADNSVTGEGQSNGTGESYLTISGIKGFEEGRRFASFADAYAAIKPELVKLCAGDALGQGVATAEAFDALFTNRDENGNATLTYTISGNIVYDETGYANLLTMGRRASHYGNDRHLINFKFVGATGKEADTLTVNSNITLPYEWWGEKAVTSISFENLTITGSAPSGLYPSQPYFEGINFKVDNCNLKGIKIYNCSNVKGTYTITNSTLDGTGAPAHAYAIHLQGNKTEPLTIIISGNTISGYDRGINIDQKTANATISGNTISIKDAGRSCIQLSSLTSTVISNNTLELTGGNAITLHEKLLTLTAAPNVTVEGNTITGNGYLIYDDAVANNKAFTSDNLKLTIRTNTVASTVDTKQGVKGSNKYNLSTVVKDALTPAYVATVNGKGYYATLAEAIANATPDDKGVITYEISGKAEISGADQWISFVKNAEGVIAVKFVGMTEDAEISITSSGSILGVQGVDVDVSFENLTLSHPNGIWVNDLGHATNYFACMVRNSGHTVTYTNCTFPNGACNNMYGNTVFNGCKFTNATSGKYNLWNYGGNTEIKNSTFTGVRGIKTFNEGTLAVAPTVKIENTKFDGLTEKAAIVTSKATDITLDNVSATKCTKGFFQKDIEYSGEKTTIEANGSAISGNFNITAEKGAAAAKKEFNISGGTFTSEVSSDYLADGFELKKNIDGTYGVKAASVAKIGTVEYASLDDAIDAAQNGEVIVVSAGVYKLNGSLTYTGKAFTIKAADGANVSFDISNDVALHGAKITFEGVTFDYKTNGNYIGIKHADTLVYNNCTINGQVFLYATNETFNGCTFNQTSADAYNVWTYGAKNVEFNKCVFNCVGKSVLLYNEGANTGTDLTVTDTTFNASAPVAGKAAIEIDTSQMGGQSKITVDKATATGFATGSNSGNSLWNDKKQTADTNQNTTVVVDGKTVFEPANFIDLDLFIKWLANNGYNVDGANYISNINAVVDGKLTVKWSPVSGCYDTRAGHICTVNGVIATGNTPKRVNSGLTQFQLFEDSNVAVTIKNVKFVYEPAAFTVCENSGWKGSFTAADAPAGQLYFRTTGDVTVDSCDFEKVVFTTFDTTGTSIVNGCTFKDVYNSYAIKDIRGGNVSVTGTKIENCGGGIMVSSTGTVSNVTITGNTFNNVDTAGTAAADKVGTRAILQIAKDGNYASTAFDFSGNTATSCGPVIRQLNATVAPVGSSLKYLTESPNSASGLYTSDSTYVAEVTFTDGTTKKYSDIAEALEAANAGDTVTLLADINTPEKTYEITKSLTIDLNGKTVTGSGYDGVFEVTGKNINVVLNATNGGKVIAVENSGSADKYAMAVWMCGAGSTLTINGGEFIQNITSTDDKQMDMIYASAGTIIINSGSFTSGTPKWTLNINDSAYKAGTANIIVNGGTFTDYDPRNAENEGKGTSLVANGVGIDKNADGTFTAKSGMAAQIVDADGNSVAAYATLADAIKAANAGDTVKLLADVTADVAINKNITLDLGGKTLNGGTGNTKATITNYGTITITDSSAEKTGTIKRDDNGTEGETSYYVIRNFGTMTIEQANIINNSGYKKTNPSGSMVGSSLICNGDDDAYSAVLNIKGGTIRQDNFIAIKNGSSATLNVTGGKITSKHSAVQNWCNANITGGELNGQLWTDSWDSNSTGNTVMGGDAKFTGEIVIDITGSIVPKFEITGGTLDVTNWKITTAAANAGAKPAVSGGKFTSAVPEEYCAEGFIPTQNEDGTYGVQKAMNGSKKNPYTLKELSEMNRADYIKAQKALGGTMYVKISDYIYDKGVLGNGVRNDTPGQMPDHSKLNAYAENGYLGDKNDGANGKNIIFVGGSITSGVEGYRSIDNIGTSLLLAVPAYTNVTFEGVTFNDVISFDYQLYTSPWSQLGELKFSGCTFNGIIVGAIAAQTLTFDGCEFKNYTNKISANNSNPTWIRPAYGNWSKGDNDGQGSDFKSLTTINFTNNTVTSTRPVKFEYISQWDITSTVTATGNYFDITAQSGDTSIKNVGLYLGAHTDANEFHLVAADNTKSENTAALYTIPSDKTSLPVDSTVKNTAGESIELTDALKWKATDAEKDKIVLKTVIAVASIGERRFATLEEAFAAAKNGDTITLLSDVELSSTIVIKDVMNVTLDLNGKKLSTTTKTGDATRHYYAIDNYGTFTLRDSSAEQSGEIRARGIENLGTGTMTIESGKIVAIDANGGAAIWNNANLTINGGTFVAEHVGASSDQYGPGCVYNNGTLTINGGTFTSANKRTYAIVSKAGTVTITPADGKNVTISGAHGGLGIDGGTAIINGGSYASSDYYGLYVSNDAGTADVTVNGGTFTGKKYSVLIGSDGSSSVTSTLKIKGGTFDMPIHAQENTIDGAIAISGGKFKFKVDDKYFANGHVCSGTPGADGYYTIADHPITKVGLTLGEDISIRIGVDAKYKDGMIKVTYETYDSTTNGMVTEEIILDRYELAGTNKYQFRISNITPQMADVVFTLQYLDSEGNEIGSAKQISIVEYCRKFAETSNFEAYRAKIGQLLNYCATAMDFRAVSHADYLYNGLSWAERATALRAKISEYGYTVADIDFKTVGKYINRTSETIITGFGIEFAESVKLYYFIALDDYKDGYTYVADGLMTPVPVYEDGQLIGYRVYLTVAMDGYHTMRTLYVYDANGNEVQRIGMAPDYALKYLYNSDKQTNEFKQLCKAAYQYFIAFAE